jgi:two-component system CheB/CheR fusion protein
VRRIHLALTLSISFLPTSFNINRWGYSFLLETRKPLISSLILHFISRKCIKNLQLVYLSGTGSDGTLEAKAIKDHGGISIVQDKESAAYDGMPQVPSMQVVDLF